MDSAIVESWEAGLPTLLHGSVHVSLFDVSDSACSADSFCPSPRTQGFPSPKTPTDPQVTKPEIRNAPPLTLISMCGVFLAISYLVRAALQTLLYTMQADFVGKQPDKTDVRTESI